jgi:hypothetical protein
LLGKRLELEELMRCPVDWEGETHIENWEWSIVHLDWLHCLGECMAEGADVPITPDDYDELFEDAKETYEIDHLLINLRLRRPEAVDLYRRRAGRLSGLNFMTPAEHGKHFRATVSKKEVAARSKNGPSLFWADYRSDLLRSTFWFWFQMFFDSVLWEQSSPFLIAPMIVYGRINDDENEPANHLRYTPVGKLWQRFMHDTNLRICMDALQPVGGCDGLLTSFLCYDLHIDAKTVHCYPISGEEAERIMQGGEIIGNDSLNC